MQHYAIQPLLTTAPRYNPELPHWWIPNSTPQCRQGPPSLCPNRGLLRCGSGASPLTYHRRDLSAKIHGLYTSYQIMDNGNLHYKEGLEWRQSCKGPGGSTGENLSLKVALVKHSKQTPCMYVCMYILCSRQVQSWLYMRSWHHTCIEKKLGGWTPKMAHICYDNIWPGGRSVRF